MEEVINNQAENPIIEETNELKEDIAAIATEETTNSSDEIAPAFVKPKRLTLKQRRLQKRIWRYSIEDDKRYRGPFSLFALRVIAWTCIVLSQLAVVFQIASETAGMTNFKMASDIISVFSSLAMPLFLLANFAYIIQNKQDILKILFTYFLMMIIVAGCFYLLYFHYIIGFYSQLAKIPFEEAYENVGLVVMLFFNNTFKFNIFVDLFVCTLFVYFFLANPKRIFTGKRIIIFRLFSIIPFGYEVAVIILKILFVNGVMNIPFLMTPFMPTKCPLTFLAFIFIVIYESRRKRKYIKYNGNDDNYSEFFKTNKNSWLFSKSAAKSFAFVGLLDLVLYLTLESLAIGFPEDLIYSTTIEALEIGESVGLLLLAPYIFLFSYNKMFKPSKLDIFLPILAVIAIVIVYMEAIYQAAGIFF